MTLKRYEVVVIVVVVVDDDDIVDVVVDVAALQFALWDQNFAFVFEQDVIFLQVQEVLPKIPNFVMILQLLLYIALIVQHWQGLCLKPVA